ncbi:24053_t:CDS:2, partial [Cetraspora pellucida]
KNIKKVHQSYTLKEKANVIWYALCEGNLRATTKFDLDKTQAKTKASPSSGVIVFFYEKSWMDEPICEWVLAAWAEIDPKIIHHAFHKCSISNTIDGSEDNEIYHDKILDNKTNEANENNPDMDSGDSGKNEKDFEDKENNDAMIEKNEDVLLFTID